MNQLTDPPLPPSLTKVKTFFLFFFEPFPDHALGTSFIRSVFTTHWSIPSYLKMGKRDAEAVNICHKGEVPLHPKCFMAYHVANHPRPTWPRGLLLPLPQPQPQPQLKLLQIQLPVPLPHSALTNQLFTYDPIVINLIY